MCAKFQSNSILLSKAILLTNDNDKNNDVTDDDNRQIDILAKTIFFTQGVLKLRDFMKILKVIFYIKPIPFYIMRM